MQADGDPVALAGEGEVIGPVRQVVDRGLRRHGCGPFCRAPCPPALFIPQTGPFGKQRGEALMAFSVVTPGHLRLGRSFGPGRRLVLRIRTGGEGNSTVR